MSDKFYNVIAALLQARENCEKTNNKEWKLKHSERIEALVKEHAPSGSGFDAGTKIDLDSSTVEKLVFTTAFHHMNEGGYYEGWTEHTVTIKAHLAYGYVVRVGGRDRNQIKDYIEQVFHDLGQIEIERPHHPVAPTAESA